MIIFSNPADGKSDKRNEAFYNCPCVHFLRSDLGFLSTAPKASTV